MKVALVCPYAWDRVGGVQSHIAALREQLVERGHETIVVAPASFGAKVNGDIVRAGRSIAIPANGSMAPLSFGPGAAASVRFALTRFVPDVVHAHEPLIPSVSLIATSVARAPVVGTFHASAPASAGYRIARPLLTRAVRRLTEKTAVSDEARSLIERYFPGSYRLTPNGVDVQRYRDAEPADLGPGKTILFLSRLERRKGLETLLQACTRIRDLGARVVVAGTGPEERGLRKLARELRIDVTWSGRVPEDRKASLFKGADMYCAPALGGESFGIVLIEAMAAGTPVVCSDLKGFRAVAAGAARLARPADPGDLADAMRSVLTDPTTAHEMSVSGARLASMFDWARLVAGVESIYERAVSEG